MNNFRSEWRKVISILLSEFAAVSEMSPFVSQNTRYRHQFELISEISTHKWDALEKVRCTTYQIQFDFDI